MGSCAKQAATVARVASLAAVREAWLFFQKVSSDFQQQVIRSHGDHIPSNARDGAMVFFWLPEVWPQRSDELASAGLVDLK
eukprot:1777302-Alexandrium_andersonii.AAC.1